MKGIITRTITCFLIALITTSCDDQEFMQTLSLKSIQEKSLPSIAREDLFAFFIQSAGGPYNIDPTLSQYVDRIAARIISSSAHRNKNFQFTIVNNSTPFAIAFPGNNIALSRSLFPLINNEAELAAILTQKAIVSTKLASHPLPNEKSLAFTLCNCPKFSIEPIISAQRLTCKTECDIDSEVLDLLTSLGYDPRALSTFYNSIKKAKFDHLFPYLKDKMQYISSQMPELEYSGYLGKKGYVETVLSLIENEPTYQVYQQSLDAFDNDHYEEALSLALQAQEQIPNESLFHLQIGKTYSHLKKEHLAHDAFSAAIRHNPLYYYPYFERAKLLDLMNKSLRARSDYEMAIDYFPSAKTLYHFGNLLFREDEKQKAIETFERVALFDSDYREKARKKVARYKGRCT